MTHLIILVNIITILTTLYLLICSLTDAIYNGKDRKSFLWTLISFGGCYFIASNNSFTIILFSGLILTIYNILCASRHNRNDNGKVEAWIKSKIEDHKEEIESLIKEYKEDKQKVSNQD